LLMVGSSSKDILDIATHVYTEGHSISNVVSWSC
jgi:hypothetical protein